MDEKERHCLHGRAVLSMVDVSCPTGELRQTRGGKRRASQVRCRLEDKFRFREFVWGIRSLPRTIQLTECQCDQRSNANAIQTIKL